MELILWIGIFVASVAILGKAADSFTLSSEKIGLHFGVSHFIVGAVIASIGTSLPELVTSIIAVVDPIHGLSTFPIDNIIGSNIANISLGLALAAIVARNLKVDQKLIDIDIPFLFISTALFVVFMLDRVFDFYEAVFSIILMLIFLAYTLSKDSRGVDMQNDIVKSKSSKLSPVVYFVLVLSSAAIYFSADYTLKSILKISDLIGLSSSVLTMIFVALGTSLPEIVVSISAVRRNNYGIAVGNVFGSNIFNVLMVSSVPAFLGAVTVSDQAYFIGIPFLIVSTMACIFITHDDQVKRWEGLAMLLIYAVFVSKLAA